MSDKLSAIQIVRRSFNWSDVEVQKFAQTAPFRYKTFPIPKRGGGDRIISQPSRDLKAIQRLLIEEVLSDNLPVHDAATAYKAGTSICDNARPHLNNRYLLKMDFKDFFPSITPGYFFKYLVNRDFLKDEKEVRFLCSVFFKLTRGRAHLCIGSPGSPVISNALLYQFDETVVNEMSTLNVAFTRYSDDLTFSTNEKNLLFNVPELVSGYLKNSLLPNITLNEKKTVFSSKKFNRHITGITITNEGRMSIGRDKKRKIRSLVFNVDSITRDEIESLRGYLSFIHQVEPAFLERLKEKYPDQMRAIYSTDFRRKYT